MGDGINDFEVVRKGAGSDLVVVSWVTPSTEPALWGIVEDGCVGKVGTGIYEVKSSVSQGPVASQTNKLTQSPVPVRLNASIAAFRPQRVLEVAEIGAVPR